MNPKPNPNQLFYLLFSLILLVFIALIFNRFQTSPQSPPAASPTPVPDFIGGLSAYPPTIFSVHLPPAYRHRFYQTSVVVRDNDPNDILQLTVTGLPAGLNLTQCTQSPSADTNSSTLTCLLSGRPATTGNFPLQLIASDKMGYLGQSSRTLTVRQWYSQLLPL